MKYSEILEEIKRIYQEDFTMESFRKIGCLNKKINEISLKQDMNNINNENNYHEVKNCLAEVVYLKLKDKLNFSDDIINKIINHIGYADDISEIYVLDGYVAYDVLSSDGKEPYFALEDSFCNITSNNFNDVVGSSLLKKLIVESINNLFREYLDEKPLKLKSNGDITCDENINIYLNSTLSYLGKINSEINNEIIKVMIHDDKDNIYYFDMKLRDGYLVLYQNNHYLHKVSEILNNKNKVKKI